MVSISSCIDYAECSYRLKYSSLKPRLEVHHAKVIALAETTKFFLMRSGEQKSTSLSVLKQRMSTAWDKVKKVNHFAVGWDDLISVQSQLGKVSHLVTSRDSVVAVNFPASCSIPVLRGGNHAFEEITATVDGIILKNQESSKKYLQILLFDYSAFAIKSPKSSLLRFVAGLYDMAIRDAKISHLPRKFSFLRLHNGNVQNVAIQQYRDDRVMDILTNILTGMNHNVHLPTTDAKICKDCLYKNICDWAQE